MGLQKLLDPEIFGCTFLGLVMLWYTKRCIYDFSKDQLSFSKDKFEDAEFYVRYMDKFLLGKKLSDNEIDILNLNKQHAIERYNSILNEKVSKFLLFSTPFFYFQARKELNSMKEESRKRLEELRTAA